MGRLVEGVWRDEPPAGKRRDGRFVRAETRFRNWVTADGSAGPTGTGGFAAAPGRYHLYVSLACPWAHRTLIMRRLKGLSDAIGVSVVHWHLAENGWEFREGPGATGDRLYGRRYLHEIYTRAEPHYSGRVSVPVLWDQERATIVNNESAEIIRMLNSAFDGVGARGSDFYPERLRPAIDALNDKIYATVNTRVYRAGFATAQDAYEEAVSALFGTLDELEERLAGQRYLAGERITEADIRLFTTLVRFDPVYVGHFKCNIRRIADYPNLSGYLRDLHQVPGVAGTVDIPHIMAHYYSSHKSLNPSGVVPAGPELDYAAPHDRARLGAIAPTG
jgi:putative glutathione S-transferase